MLEAWGKQCHSPTDVERVVWSHTIVPGEHAPRPCTAPTCRFARDPDTAIAEYEAMLATEAELAAVISKKGKAVYSRWRMKHAGDHHQVQPGLYGRPMLYHDMRRQILDPLHLSELGLPKTFWKHGVLNNASDDARDQISERLRVWKHPLDCRRKDNNRVRANKWFTGERWATFCAGERGSPGGPRAMAELMMIVAEDMQQRGVTMGSADEPGEVEVIEAGSRGGGGRGGGGRGRGRGRGAHTARLVAAACEAPTAVAVEVPELKHVPTAMERACDQADLAMIIDLYGSRGRTIINTLLAADSYFNWYYPFKQSIPFRAPPAVKLARAFDNACLAVPMVEMFERVAIRKHGSYLPHLAVSKVTRDISEVADVWATGPNLSSAKRGVKAYSDGRWRQAPHTLERGAAAAANARHERGTGAADHNEGLLHNFSYLHVVEAAWQSVSAAGGWHCGHASVTQKGAAFCWWEAVLGINRHQA